MKTLKKKLTLHRETLRNLAGPELSAALGGATQRTCGDTCNASCYTETCWVTCDTICHTLCASCDC